MDQRSKAHGEWKEEDADDELRPVVQLTILLLLQDNSERERERERERECVCVCGQMEERKKERKKARRYSLIECEYDGV